MQENNKGWFTKFFQIIFVVTIYPFVIVFGLVIMLLAGVFSIFQSFPKLKDKEDSSKQQWGILAEHLGTKVFMQYKGEVRFGPAYFNLRTEPLIPEIENRLFGDWFCRYKEGILLQEWNSTKNADTALIYLDLKARRAYIIKDEIPAVLWEISGEKENLVLNCNTGNEMLTYRIDVPKNTNV